MCDKKKRWEHQRKLKALFESDNLIEKQKDIKSYLIYGISKIPRKKIGIVIPNYNRWQLFEKAFESVIYQTVNQDLFNIIIVDDSRDDYEKEKTLEIIKKYKKKNVWYFQNEKQMGLFGNMNRGVLLSNSEWVCFLHNDDILYSDAVERAIKAIKYISDDNTMSIYPTHDFIAEDGRITKTNYIEIKRPFYRWLVSQEHNRVKKREMNKLCYGDEERCVAPSCGAMFRTEALIAYGGYAEGYGAGDLFLLYGLSKNYKCYVINEAWGAFRWAENESLNKETIAAYIEERQLILDYFQKYYQKNLLQYIDIKVQYLTFYYGVIKRLLGTDDDKEIEQFLKKYAPQYRNYPHGIFLKYLQRIRAYMIDKYIILYNIIHSERIPYERRVT